jgi:hypothetical protein
VEPGKYRVTFDGEFLGTDANGNAKFRAVGDTCAVSAWLPSYGLEAELLELDEPPVGSVVLDDDGDAWQNDQDGWSLALRLPDSDAFDWSWTRLNEEYGPVKVVYRP